MKNVLPMSRGGDGDPHGRTALIDLCWVSTVSPRVGIVKSSLNAEEQDSSPVGLD